MEEEPTNRQEIKQKPEEKEKEMFIGKSIYESFNYFNHYNSSNSKEEYYRLCRVIQFGKELLPYDVKDTNDQTKIDKLYRDACEALQSEILKKPTQKFGWGDPASKAFPIYTMSADDGGNVSCVQDQYVEAIMFFRETQYDGHIKNLRDIESKIFRFLTKYEVVPRKKPSVDEIMEEKLVEKFDPSYKKKGVK